ncbi:MAG: fasciclin domain-containing protein [Pseudomonadota bacterium]
MLRRSLLTLAAALLVSACAAPSRSPNIVEVAQSAGQFDTLVAAVSAADLVETLSGPGPFTVFAPTDAAFAALPDGTLDSLLQPENKGLLTSILTYHVVPGRITAADLTGQRLRVTTVNGATLHIDGRNGVRVNQSNVVSPDVAASNGIIHVIDRVLLP